MALFSPVRRTTVCEGGEQKIDCQGDQKLEIVSADFGRWDRGVCKRFLGYGLAHQLPHPQGLGNHQEGV